MHVLNPDDKDLVIVIGANRNWKVNSDNTIVNVPHDEMRRPSVEDAPLKVKTFFFHGGRLQRPHAKAYRVQRRLGSADPACRWRQA